MQLLEDVKFFSTTCFALVLFFFSCTIDAIYKIISNRKIFWERPEVTSGIDLRNQIVLVTGANTGIGKQTATKVAKLGATCIIACRNEQKGLAARNEIMAELKRAPETFFPYASFGCVEYMHIDLARLETVVKFTEDFKMKYKKLNILFNNAGLSTSGKTPDGLPQLFQVNYLGHYLLFRLLQPIMTSLGNEAPPRVISLSSVMHHFGDTFFQYEVNKSVNKKLKIKRSGYGNSKLFFNLLTIEINKRYSTTNSPQPIIAISVNPGAVRSDIWRSITGITKVVYDILMRILYLSVDLGSMTSVFAAIVSDNEIAQQRIKQSEGSRQPEAEYHLPYVIPYTVWGRSVAMEMMGPYTGPVWGRTSLPERALQVSEELWKYSEELCEKILGEKGIKDVFVR